MAKKTLQIIFVIIGLLGFLLMEVFFRSHLPLHKLSDNVLKGTIFSCSTDEDDGVLVYEDCSLKFYTIDLSKVIQTIQMRGKLTEYKKSSWLDADKKLPAEYKTYFVLSEENNKHFLTIIGKFYQKVEKLCETEVDSDKIAFYVWNGDAKNQSVVLQKKNVLTFYDFRGNKVRIDRMDKENAFVFKNAFEMGKYSVIGFDGHSINLFLVSNDGLKLYKAYEIGDYSDIYKSVEQCLPSLPADFHFRTYFYTICGANAVYIIYDDAIYELTMPRFEFNLYNCLFATREGIFYKNISNPNAQSGVILEGAYDPIFSTDFPMSNLSECATVIFGDKTPNSNILYLVLFNLEPGVFRIYKTYCNAKIISAIYSLTPLPSDSSKKAYQKKIVLYANDGIYFIDYNDFIDNWKSKYYERLQLAEK